jgi:hypothetical protein
MSPTLSFLSQVALTSKKASGFIVGNILLPTTLTMLSTFFTLHLSLDKLRFQQAGTDRQPCKYLLLWFAKKRQQIG